MTYPKELWENTRLEHKTYPIQLFQNRFPKVKSNDCILYLHWHEHFEIIVMREGSAVFHIDSRPYIVNEGEVIIIPGGSLHVGYALHYGNVHYDCIVLNAALFNDWCMIRFMPSLLLHTWRDDSAFPSSRRSRRSPASAIIHC
ncbi:AraC family ligand binding domain-containing protein [Paenibacillus sp. Soil766]|uniref:AraC family ligand binding domain-containing protein n=1 Tax=Paenibacillus sp. Soil766 TaxID=1736404 RepID=UPI0026C689E9|nr:AraC family ligand binding domain-containing protein [Paenibacillus sp. Soil766]